MDTSLSNYTDRMKVTVLLFVVLIYYICDNCTYKYETVPVVVKDAFAEPSTVTDGCYIPEKYYLVIEDDNDQYVWTVQGKEDYNRYKDMVGETIEAGIKVYTETERVLYQLEGQEVTGCQEDITYESSPSL